MVTRINNSILFLCLTRKKNTSKSPRLAQFLGYLRIIATYLEKFSRGNMNFTFKKYKNVLLAGMVKFTIN